MTRSISMTPTCSWGHGPANALRPISISIGRPPEGPMEAKPVGAVAVTRKRWPLMAALALLLMGNPFAREGWAQMTDNPYQKRALDAAEVDLLFSYYKQDGQHAAVTGGEGTEALTDASSSLVVRMPLGERDILTVDRSEERRVGKDVRWRGRKRQ